jgi:hypothetical protein
MSLFVCRKCKVIENTALGAFWGREKERQLCSECDRGRWHNAFEKEYFDQDKWEYEEDSDFVKRKI